MFYLNLTNAGFTNLFFGGLLTYGDKFLSMVCYIYDVLNDKNTTTKSSLWSNNAFIVDNYGSRLCQAQTLTTYNLTEYEMVSASSEFNWW